MFMDFDADEPTFHWDTVQAKAGACQVSLHGCLIDIPQIAEVRGELGTGTVVWDSGVSLAEYISQHYDREALHGMHVMELGAGVGGLPGIAAVLGGAEKVIFTDQAQIVPLLRENVLLALESAARQRRLSGEPCDSGEGSVQVCAFDWEHLDQFAARTDQFDLILLADVILEEESVKKLVPCLARLCVEETEVLWVYQWRCAILDKLVKLLLCKYFTIFEVPRDELGEKWKGVSREYLHLYKMRLKHVSQ